MKSRVAVVAPGETPTLYPRGREPQNHTAFREAERMCKKKDLDLTKLVDTRHLQTDERVKHCHDGLYTVEGTGFFVAPGWLSVEEQVDLITQSLCHFTTCGLTNLDAHYHVPKEGLWSFLKEEKMLRIERKPTDDDSSSTRNQPLVLELNQRQEQMDFMRKFRWVSLGLQYNWSTKDYFAHSVPMPERIALLSSQLCRRARLCDNFACEAGIVNFYQPGDTLTGHVDRSEPRMDVPLVSVSLGAPCVFLLGGATRDDPVLPLVLHSGDVVFLSGPSRAFYHGVPRILEDDFQSRELRNQCAKTEEQKLALEVLGKGRVNLNVRQVY